MRAPRAVSRFHREGHSPLQLSVSHSPCVERTTALRVAIEPSLGAARSRSRRFSFEFAAAGVVFGEAVGSLTRRVSVATGFGVVAAWEARYLPPSVASSRDMRWLRHATPSSSWLASRIAPPRRIRVRPASAAAVAEGGFVQSRFVSPCDRQRSGSPSLGPETRRSHRSLTRSCDVAPVDTARFTDSSYALGRRAATLKARATPVSQFAH